MFRSFVKLAGLALVGAVVIIASGPSLSNIHGVAQPTTATPTATSNSGATAPSSATAAPRSAGASTTGTTPASLPQPVTDVTSFGAKGDGRTDSEQAVVNAIAVAQARGGTLFFPAGHYMLYGPGIGAAVRIQTGLPLTVAGAGASLTTLTETNPKGALLSAQVDHTVVQDLTLDTQSVNARQVVNLGANYVTVQRCRILGGSQIFAIYATGQPGTSAAAPLYRVGNQLLDDVINEQLADDGVSWSFQANSLIQNIDHTGSRLALYRDHSVTVQNYTYHPGITPTNNGFWISAPSDNITINNFTSYGKGGVLTPNSGYADTNIVINNERVLGTGHALRVAGAVGLTINGCDFGTTNSLDFEGTAPMSNITVQNCTSLPMVRFAQKTALTVHFVNNTYPAFTPLSGQKTTFHNYTVGPLTFTVNGGWWRNAVGGFFSGSAATYSVTNLIGYR